MTGKQARALRRSRGGITRVTHVINSLGIGGAERQLSLLVASLPVGFEQVVRPLVHANNAVAINEALIVHPSRSRLVSISRAFVGASLDALKVGGGVLVGWMYHSWLVVLAAHLASVGRVRVLLYCRHGDPRTLNWVTRTIAWLCLRWAARFKIPVVFNSESSRVAHECMAPGLVCRVIPNGVFAPDGRGRRLRSGTGGVIGFLGRNHEDKGADRLIEIIPDALAGLEGWSFNVAGPGMEALRPAIDQRLIRLGIAASRVNVSGAVTEVSRFYDDVDVLVVPSRTESFPNVVVEAAARGVIPVCMGVGEIPAILSGLVDVAEDVDSLKEILKSLCRLEAAKREQISDKLVERVLGDYSVDAIAQKHRELWEGGGNGS